MSKSNRTNRKAEDEDIIRLNSLSLSLRTIGAALGIHPTSVAQRLKSLGVEPADTRRSFMESIVLSLTDDQAYWLAEKLGPAHSLRELVRGLIIDQYVREHK